MTDTTYGVYPLPETATVLVLTIAPPSVLVSEEARRIFQWVVYGAIMVTINIFGIATNIINIICFVKQGLRDPLNISLLGLAVSDLGSLVTLLGTCIFVIPAFQDADLPFDSVEMQYMITGWPHVMFTRVTSWLTALITIERCLCITMPLKVKRVFTSKRVTVITICIFVFMIAAISPLYYVNRYAWMFSPERNMTVLGLVYTDDRNIVETYTHGINNVFIPFSAYFVVIICTVVLVVKLREKTRWRLACTSGKDADTLSERDQKVAKMVVMISGLFVTCFIPLCVMFIAMIVDPKIGIDGQYKNTFYILAGVSVLFEAGNSATNIFIYYHMSTKYRSTFRELFRRNNEL